MVDEALDEELEDELDDDRVDVMSVLEVGAMKD